MRLALVLPLSGCLLSGKEAGSGDDDVAPPPMCTDDSAFEPNDTISSAFQTGVSGSMSGTTFGGLSTCPSGDRDHYQIDLLDTEVAVLVTATWDDTSMPLSILLLDGSGTVITGTRPQDASSAFSCAVVPAGTYFAQVSGPPNNYRLDIDTFIGGTCP